MPRWSKEATLGLSSAGDDQPGERAAPMSRRSSSRLRVRPRRSRRQGIGADLAWLRRTVGDARIVGLGESTHGASELFRLKHRTLRFLVEELGFRSIAWEEDWTIGLQVNRYLLGDGDLDQLIPKLSTTWRSR